MVTEIGFVGLLIAGLGGLAGGLVYLAARVARGPVVTPRTRARR